MRSMLRLVVLTALLLPLLAGCLATPPALPDGGDGTGLTGQGPPSPPRAEPGEGASPAVAEVEEGPLEAIPEEFDRTDARWLLRHHTSSGCGGPCYPWTGFRHPPRHQLFVLFEDLRALVVEYNTEPGEEGFAVEPNVTYDPAQLRSVLSGVRAADGAAVWVVRVYTAAFPAEAHPWLAPRLNATWAEPGFQVPCADCTPTWYAYAPRAGDERRTEVWPDLNATDPFRPFHELASGLAEAAEARGAVQGPGDQRPVRREHGPVPGCTVRQATPRYEALQDETAWAGAWAEACAPMPDGNPPPRPRVDFERFVVLGAFWGARSSGGHALDLDLAEQRHDVQVVKVIRTQPGDGCATAAVVTYPGMFYLTARPGDLAFDFQVVDRTMDCL